MISIVIPSYKNPEYLDLCLKSILDGQDNEDNDVKVVIDGHEDMYQDLIERYAGTNIYFATPVHLGFNQACNLGVTLADCRKILLLNEDNVVAPGFDTALEYHDFPDDMIVSVQQCEPDFSIFNFVMRDYGKTALHFDYTRWMNESPELAQSGLGTRDAYTFPLFFSKSMWLNVNGLDPTFGTFVSDLDLYWRWQQLGCSFMKTHETVVYHFGSKSTKKRDGGALIDYDAEEKDGYHFFKHKHGFIPGRTAQTNEVFPLLWVRKPKGEE